MHLLVFGIGMLAQAFFSARILVQWILSERSRHVVTPTAYWAFSLIGSALMFVYGICRHDFSILLGQTITYYIYIWNLHAKGHWKSIRPSLVRYLMLALPPLALFLLASNADEFLQSLFRNENIPLWLLLLGSVGQIVFALRFVYQWYYSYRRGESMLPMGFWLCSLAGASLIIIYAIIRLDPVLILGQGFGFIAYFRNIVLLRREHLPNK